MASGGGDGSQQQDPANPRYSEQIWLEYIRENYPNLEQNTYFYPPLYFNRVRFAVEEFCGLPVAVSDLDPQRRAPLCQAPAQPSTSAGTPSIFIENPPDLSPPMVQESDQRDDQAQCECLSFLGSISPPEPMVVIAQLEFKNYLNVNTSPNYRADIQQLPGLPSNQKGDWDVLIIHRHFGLIAGEVKAVGGSAEHPPTPKDILKKVGRALEQLEKQQTVLECLVKDLNPPGGSGIRVTRVLMLPNLTRGQLDGALNGSEEVKKHLYQTLSNTNDPTQARRHVLCKDDLQRATQWWNDLRGQGSNPCMTFDIYERLVARFCGQATTVSIPIACTMHRSQVSTVAETVDEVSLRFSTITLTSTQLTLLLERPDKQRVVYCQGPPGCGKTVVLLLKAVQWVKREKKVVIISQPSASAAVSMLIKHQLTKLVGKDNADMYIRVHSVDFDARLNVSDDVKRLWGDHGSDCAILCDEVPIRNADNFVPWLEEVRRTSQQNQATEPADDTSQQNQATEPADVTSPQNQATVPADDTSPQNQATEPADDTSPHNEPMVWMAGVWSRDGSAHSLLQLPSWVEVCPMSDPLRCPPVIAKVVQGSRLIGQYVGQYAMPTRPVHAEGLPVIELRHRGTEHCAGNNPLLCKQCTDAVAKILKDELKVGVQGQPLQYRDVLILSNGYEESPEPPMVQRLRNEHEMPVASIRGTTLREADVKNLQELALAQTDQIIETHSCLVRGLERKVVISVAPHLQDYEFESFSRSTSYLIRIDK